MVRDGDVFASLPCIYKGWAPEATTRASKAAAPLSDEFDFRIALIAWRDAGDFNEKLGRLAGDTTKPVYHLLE